MKLENELKQVPVNTAKLIWNLAERFKFGLSGAETRIENETEVTLVEYKLGVRVLSGKLSLSIKPFMCTDAFYYEYVGAARDNKGRVIEEKYSAYVLQGTGCRGQFARAIKRLGNTPSWFPVEDDN